MVVGVAGFVVRFVVAATLLRAGLAKTRYPAAFRVVVGDYRLLPSGLVPAAAVAVPVVEIGIGLLLVVGLGTGAAGIVAAILLTGFDVGIAVNLVRGRRIVCGCVGASSTPISWRHVTVNGLLVGACVVLALGAAQPLALQTVIGASPAPAPSGESSVAVGALLMTFTVALAAWLVSAAAYVQHRVRVLTGPVGGQGYRSL